MSLHRYKTLILVITVALALMVASPALQQLMRYPKADNLTEFWLLGEDHDALYPSNVTNGETYRVYLGARNHLGSAAYYNVEIKFSADPESSPNGFTHTPSELPSLGRLTFVATENGSFEMPLDISFQYSGGGSGLDVNSVTINGAALDTDTTLPYDSEREGYFGNLVFELWIHNETTNSFQYHERYVNLWLKMLT